MKILSVGECMVEFFREDDGTWRRGFAGDTLNAAWAMRALLPQTATVAYVSRIGSDGVSDDMEAFVRATGIVTDHMDRDPERTVGLYTISTDEFGERSFAYWRSDSAARRLADDADALATTLAIGDLVYMSGITAAILGRSGRANLLAALRKARQGGARIVYDSNYRPKLWGTAEAACDFGTRIAGIADILLPTFEDEAALFGDADPAATAERLSALGAAEVVIKHGTEPTVCRAGGKSVLIPVERPVQPVDTTGAGDSFSGAYIAARVMGDAPERAVLKAQAASAAVVGHRGALVPMTALRAAIASVA